MNKTNIQNRLRKAERLLAIRAAKAESATSELAKASFLNYVRESEKEVNRLRALLAA